MSDEGEFILSVDEAFAMLPDKETIHTFIQGGGFLLGADWSAEEVREALRQSIRIELAGATATSMGHKLVFWKKFENKGGWVFVETKDDEV